MRRLLLPLIPWVSAFSVLAARPALSAALVRSIPVTQAQAGGAQVSVWLGSGTNIDFTRTEEMIQKVWLDDPSRLTVDFDGALSGFSSEGLASGSGGSGASVIHLRRVTGISFPNLPETATTLLTVVTQTSSGSRNLYQFEINYGSGTPQYATVALMPSVSSTSSSSGSLVVSSGRSATLTDIERGLNQAIGQKLIQANSPIVARTQDFIARARNGETVQAAAAAANVSLAVVSQLATMGLPALRPTLPTTGVTDSDIETPLDTESSVPASVTF